MTGGVVAAEEAVVDSGWLYSRWERAFDERRASQRALVNAQRPTWSEVLQVVVEGHELGVRAWSFGTLTFPPVFFEDRWGRLLSRYAMKARAHEAWLGFLGYQRDRGESWEWVCAEELHQSGLPHFHVLISGHLPVVTVSGDRVRQVVAMLEGDWSASSKGGISRWRPVNAARVHYLTKYVAKGSELMWSDAFAARWRATR